jgi:uncharacterized membrane protein (DUF106 family)
MDIKEFALPVLGVVFSVGVAFQGLQEAKATTDDLSERVQEIEVKQAETGSTVVMVKQNTERLERLEAVVEKMADQQIQMLANQARICEKLDANCTQ